MNNHQDIHFNNIQAMIKNYTQQNIKDILLKISKEYNIQLEDLVNKYLNDDIKESITEIDECQCIAKMKKGTQCNRKKRKNCNFCSFHYKSLPFGTISQSNKDKYIETWIDEDLGEEYLIDNNDIVYTNNPKSPIMIGKKNKITGEIDKICNSVE